MSTAQDIISYLEELRRRIFICVGAWLVASIPCGIWWKQIVDFLLLYPLRLTSPAPQIIYTGPTDVVVLSLHIAMFGGLIVASPVILHQVWSFVSSALYKREKIISFAALVASIVMFVAGASTCYFIAPYILEFFVKYSGGRMTAMFRADQYLAFMMQLTLAFGLVFEMPVVSFVLAGTGILSPSFLLRKIRYAIVVIFIVAAVITPPDVLSQCAMAVPLIALYGISILVAWLAYPRSKNDQRR